MTDYKVSISILDADLLNLEKEIKKIENAGVASVHLDVMDGHFVSNISFGAKLIKAINQITNLPLNVHLMIDNPAQTIKNYIDCRPNSITFHIESEKEPITLINRIKQNNIKAGIALNPLTSFDAIEDLLKEIDEVLVMTVNPGMGGQPFMEDMLPKIRQLAQKHVDIAVDGGVNAQNYNKIVLAGANTLVVGSAFFNGKWRI